MTFPTNYARVWVRGRFIDLGKAARGETNIGLAGSVQFIPSAPVLLNDDLQQIIATKRLSVVPAALDGYFAIELPVTDDPDLNPVDFTYEVIEPTGRRYHIVVPYDTPTIYEPGEPLDGEQVIELANVVPNPDANPGTVQLLVGQTGRGIESVEFVGSDLIVTMTDDEVINVGPFGEIGFANLPTGTAADEVAVGNHGHAYAPTSHTHPFSDVTGTATATQLPRVPSGNRSATVSSGTYALDASSGNDNNVSLTFTGNATIGVPTNGINNQVVQYACLASGGSRTITLNASFARLTGVDASYVVPSGKILRLSIRYTTLDNSWIAEAAAVTQ